MYTHIHTHPYAQTHTDCISAQVRGWPCCSVSLGVPEMEALAFSWRSSLRQHTRLNSAVLETQAPKILLQLSAHFLCVCTAFQPFGVRGLCSCTPTNTPVPPPPRLLPAPSLRWDVGGRAIKKKSWGGGAQHARTKFAVQQHRNLVQNKILHQEFRGNVNNSVWWPYQRTCSTH